MAGEEWAVSVAAARADIKEAVARVTMVLTTAVVRVVAMGAVVVALRAPTASGAVELMAVAVLMATLARGMAAARAAMQVAPAADRAQAVRETATQVGTRETLARMAMTRPVLMVLVMMGVASTGERKAAVTREVGEAARKGEGSSSSDPLPSLFYRSEASP